MKYKITVSLIALNVLLFGSIHYINSNPDVLGKSDPKEIVTFNPFEIQDIRIDLHSQNEFYQLSQNLNNWELTHPIQWRANPHAIQRILNQLQFLKPEVAFTVEEILGSGQTLSDYGLAQPKITLTLSSSSTQYKLQIGKSTNLGNRLYVLGPDQEHIFVVQDSLIDSIALSFENIRNNNIFDIPHSSLNNLSIQNLKPHNLKIRLSKNNENNWLIQTPIQANANNSLVANAISQLTNLTAESFISKNNHPAEPGFNSPKMRITLQNNSVKQTLILGNNVPESNNSLYFAKLQNNPTIFTISADSILELENAQNQLRDKHLFFTEPTSLTTIQLTQDDQSIAFNKLENNTWKIKSQEKSLLQSSLADTPTIDHLLQSLHNLEAINFVSDAPSQNDLETFGLSSPQRSITLSGPKSSQTLLVGDLDSKSGNLFAKFNNLPFIYHINPNILALTPISTTHYLDKNLETLPEAAVIESIKLTNLQTNIPLLDFNTNNTSIDQSTQALIKCLGSMSVNNYINDAFTPDYSPEPNQHVPWNFKLEADITLPGGEGNQHKTYEFFLTKRLNGTTQIASSKNHNCTFSLNQDWIDALFAITEADSL